MERFASWAEWEAVEGWCSAAEAERLFVMAARLAPGWTAVELGTYHGRTTIALALGCWVSHSQLVTVDNFRGNPEHTAPPRVERFYENLERCGVERYDVRLLVEDTVAAAALVHEDVHLLYVDAKHVKAQIIAEVAAWLAHGVPYVTTVAFHDYGGNWPEVTAAVDDLRVRMDLEEIGRTGSIAEFIWTPKKGKREGI